MDRKPVTVKFNSNDALMHFLHENLPEQFACIRHSESDIELTYMEEVQHEPTTA